MMLLDSVVAKKKNAQITQLGCDDEVEENVEERKAGAVLPRVEESNLGQE
jgi:hypothetical protein